MAVFVDREHSAPDLAAQDLRQHPRVVALVEAGVRPREFIQEDVDGTLADGNAKQDAPALVAGQLPAGSLDIDFGRRRRLRPARRGRARRAMLCSTAALSSRPSGFPRPSREPGSSPAGYPRIGWPRNEGSSAGGFRETREREVLPEGLGQALGRGRHDDQRVAAREPAARVQPAPRVPAPPPWETMGHRPSSARSCPRPPAAIETRPRWVPPGAGPGCRSDPPSETRPRRPRCHCRAPARQGRPVGDAQPAPEDRQDGDAQCHDGEQDPPGPRGFTQERAPPR